MSILTPVVWAVVHPVDTGAHPSVPPGWRWAVMCGDGPAYDPGRCANAGWCPSREEALAEGDQNAATAANSIRIAGAPFQYRPPIVLDHDPVPAGCDRLNVA